MVIPIFSLLIIIWYMIAIIFRGVIGVMHTVAGVCEGDKDGEGVRMMEKDGENLTKNARKGRDCICATWCVFCACLW